MKRFTGIKNYPLLSLLLLLASCGGGKSSDTENTELQQADRQADTDTAAKDDSLIRAAKPDEDVAEKEDSIVRTDAGTRADVNVAEKNDSPARTKAKPQAGKSKNTAGKDNSPVRKEVQADKDVAEEANNPYHAIAATQLMDSPIDLDDEVYSVVEQPPAFPGGEAALLRYIAENLRYPEEALDKEIQGVVNLRFVVMPDGSVGEVLVTKSLDPSCDREAVRVVKSLPRFTPAMQKGRPVAVWFNLPIRFVLR